MTNDAPNFVPGWVSAPGNTISMLLLRRGISRNDFAQAMGSTPDEVNDLLVGRGPITRAIARKLAAIVGGQPEFWLKREVAYRSGAERLRKTAARPETRSWLHEIGANDLVKLEWFASSDEPVDLAVACLQFFGVSSVDDWREAYAKEIRPAAFRTSTKIESSPGAVAAWLRKGELTADAIPCSEWDPARFRNSLAQIRELTREPDPACFLPALSEHCSQSGVALVVIRAPSKCRASGAVHYLPNGRPIIQLSFRYLSDDHFWFTFFHEAGHLLLHGKDRVFLEGEGRIRDEQEIEANTFAQDTLIPPAYQAILRSMLPTPVAVIRFAQRIGIARGIVVGQLQHAGIIRRNQLNRLKHWYEWDK